MDRNFASLIHLLQTNLMRSSKALQDLLMFSKENKVDIALFSEPPTHNNVMIGIKNVSIIQSNDNMYRNKSCILIFNKSLQIDFSKFISSPLLTALQLTIYGSEIYLISAYGDPECQLSSLLHHLITITEDCQYIIGGDLNARTSLWGDQITNFRTRLVEEFIPLKILL